MKIIIVLLAIAAALWQPAAAQTAPDLGILWQKEIPGLDVKYAKFSHDGQFVHLSVGNNIKKMAIETGEIVLTFDNPTGKDLWSFEISGMGNFIVSHDGNGKMNLWDVNLGKMVKEYSSSNIPNIGNIHYADISPDESKLYLSVFYGGSYYLLIYNLLEDKEIKRIKFEEQLHKLKVSHDGKYLVTGLYYEDMNKGIMNKLILWETETWQQVAVLEDIEGNDSYTNLKFSPNDAYLGSVRMLPYDVHIFDLNTKILIKTSETNRKCNNIEFLPDNIHFLLNYFTWNEEHDLELHNFKERIKNYKYSVGILESFDSNQIWKIFACRTPNFILLTNGITSVNEGNSDNNILMYFDDGKVHLDFTGIVTYPVNVTIYDIVGNVIHSEIIMDLLPNLKYELKADLPSGLFIGKIITGNKEYTFKLNIVR